MLTLRFLFPCASLWLLVACTSQPLDPQIQEDEEFQVDAKACYLVSAVECQTMLDGKGVTGRSQSNVLMSVALTELGSATPNADKAISFLSGIVHRDPTYALAHQNLGAALLLSAQQHNASGNTLRAVGDSMGSIVHSQRAIELDPAQEMPYVLAIGAAGFMRDCASAYQFKQMHVDRFGSNAQQATMDAVMAKTCPDFRP